MVGEYEGRKDIQKEGVCEGSSVAPILPEVSLTTRFTSFLSWPERRVVATFMDMFRDFRALRIVIHVAFMFVWSVIDAAWHLSYILKPTLLVFHTTPFSRHTDFSQKALLHSLTPVRNGVNLLNSKSEAKIVCTPKCFAHAFRLCEISRKYGSWILFRFSPAYDK